MEIYLENLISKYDLTKSLKKKLATMYKINVPIEIEIREIKNPNHCPKNIPEIINKGDPKPKSTIQINENKKNEIKFK